MNKSSKKGLVPALRFPEFKGTREWEVLSANKAFQQISNKNHSSDLPILAITQEYGAIPRELIDYKVSATDKSIQSYKVVEIGDFVISLRSFQGGIEYSNYKGICSPAYVILRKKNNVNECFFKQYFKTPAFIRDLTKNLEGLRDGKMISYKQFSDVPLPLPSMAEQQKIADCLSSLDELIVAHTQKHQALQSYKKGLMQNLFPSKGESVPALRFPEFLDEEAWAIKPMKKLFKIGSGRDHKHLTNGNIPVYGSGGYMRSVNEYLYDGESACIGRKGTIDKPIYLSGKFWTVDTLFYTHSFNGCLPKFIYFIFQNINWRSHNEAGGVPSLSKANIEKIKVASPKLDEQRKIIDCVSSVDDLITAQAQKTEDLKTYKKGLMQQLFPTVEEVEA